MSPMKRARKPTDTERLNWLQETAGDRDRGLCWRSRFFKKFVAYDGEKSYRGHTVRQAIDAAMLAPARSKEK